MKVEELLESPPDFVDKEMPVLNVSTINFYSIDTIEREFVNVGKTKIGENEYWTLLKKDNSFAVIGELGNRKEDNKVGIQLVGQLDFKDKPDLAFDREIKTQKQVLQVDSVQIYSSNKFKGLGYNMYLSLMKYGFILVSDHTQYIGGRKLWEKIAKMQADYSVYVVSNGHVLSDENGPIKYDGSNIPDDQIWAEPSNDVSKSKRYVLLMMKKN